MKLLSFTAPHLPVLGSLSNVQCASPPSNLKGWRVSIRGAALFLLSPPGWSPGAQFVTFDPSGPRRTFGPLPMAQCICHWDGDNIEACAKYDGEPMGVPAAVLSDEELERATAPKGKAVAR
jgi:hypothetical protein